MCFNWTAFSFFDRYINGDDVSTELTCFGGFFGHKFQQPLFFHLVIHRNTHEVW